MQLLKIQPEPQPATTNPAIGTKEYQIALIREQLDIQYETLFGHTLFDKWPDAEIAQVMNVVRITMEIRGGCELYPTFAAWFMDDIGIDYFEELGAVYREGDHPDYGGGREFQDIEDYQIECGPLFGAEFAKLIGEDNHAALVDHLMNS